ncbi:MAG: asparagine synthase (glutamine-hydrolyzing) [Candidatus Muproteobacteria bacterium RBG_16_65_31]|uniref:asparagine synthase (glutamine-hydrolyzing) n=1 Tax=Candidatus Muproteobacteria bacterium RBG_16_65_31 TaxID=1817759 RepID=A0A1F6TG59_9PROT|nr:MAG: asparagine synthase (glutamine-hydrolyzing) [Candidatus Muproteobacteria bacterium RBG_16_65_31]
MCGIVGYCTGGGGDFRLDEAIGFLRLRGPDEQRTWKGEAAGLGHTRLSIIDLSEAGRQPMTSDDGRYVLVFNGEVYNFPDLRQRLEALGEKFRGHSDTEVLLKLFIRDGFEECLRQLRGMFAFAVWDRNERTLHLARDRLGVKPLVYAATPKGFLFASEIGALFVLDPALDRRPDYRALDHYFTFQYIPAPMTGFESVRKLPPAHAMIVKDGKIGKIWRYWRIDATKQDDLSFDDACEGLREKFLEATKIRMISDVPLGAFLSGGIDSSITVAAMARLNSQPVKTFAIGFEEERFNELPYARQIARHLHTDHHELIVKPDAVAALPKIVEHCGEPLADNSTIPTYFVSKLARDQVTVALTGDGGDEVFGGYKRFYQMSLIDRVEALRLLPLWRAARRLTVGMENLVKPEKRHRRFPVNKLDEALGMEPLARYKHLIAFFTDAAKNALYTPAFARAAGASGTDEYLAHHFGATQGADAVNRYLLLDMTTYLPEDILFKVDICSMLNSLECRSPFLDHRLIEFVASLPGSYKVKFPKRHKHLLKEAFKDWLPPGFMRRGKKGFSSPMSDWLRGDLRPLMQERLLAEKRLAPWVRQERIETYVSEHLSGRKSHSERLWLLLVLAEWVSLFRVPL